MKTFPVFGDFYWCSLSLSSRSPAKPVSVQDQQEEAKYAKHKQRSRYTQPELERKPKTTSTLLAAFLLSRSVFQLRLRLFRLIVNKQAAYNDRHGASIALSAPIAFSLSFGVRGTSCMLSVFHLVACLAALNFPLQVIATLAVL